VAVEAEGMSDTYADGTPCIVKVLTPKGDDWREIPMDKRYSLGFPSRAFIHKSNLAVISAVEVASEPGMDKGFEYHVSISKQFPGGFSGRCDSNEAKWVLDQFGLDGAEEDNHVPHGIVRNFWRPVADRLVGIECPCKAEEPAIREDKGDFVWRPTE
jgi:hypothetical protein